MFHNVSKVVLCDRRNTFASFSEDDSHFALGDLHRHFVWRAQLFRRVVLHAHFGNLNVRAASSGDNVQIPWQAWRFVRCDEIDGNFARNIDFEVANFEVHEKTRGKCQF